MDAIICKACGQESFRGHDCPEGRAVAYHPSFKVGGRVEWMRDAGRNPFGGYKVGYIRRIFMSRDVPKARIVSNGHSYVVSIHELMQSKVAMQKDDSRCTGECNIGACNCCLVPRRRRK